MSTVWLHGRAEWEGQILISGFKSKFVSELYMEMLFVDGMGEVYTFMSARGTCGSVSGHKVLRYEACESANMGCVWMCCTVLV